MTNQQDILPDNNSDSNPIISEIDNLNEASGIEDVSTGIDEDSTGETLKESLPVDSTSVPSPEQVQETGQSEQPVQAEPPSSEQPVEGNAPAFSPAEKQYTPEDIQTLAKQAAEYQQVQQKATIQQESVRYQKQLEAQGYLPEQAQQVASQYMQGRQQQSELVKQADNYAQYIMGKQNAAVHYADQYKLGLKDLATLQMAESVEQMESIAKKMAHDRERDDELAKFRQAQVPPQQFDNSQGEPSVAANDAGWLDRYNAGDRTPNAVSAARRAAGLE